MNTKIMTEKRTGKEGALAFSVIVEQDGSQVTFACPDEKRCIKLASKLLNDLNHFSSEKVTMKAAMIQG